MGKTFAKGENSKKAAGNAKKATAAANKQASANATAAAQEDQEWAQGSKSNSKKEDAAAKKQEAAAKKAERDAQLAAEEANARSAPKNSKSATKKASVATSLTPARGLDLAQLDGDTRDGGSSSSLLPALNASGIDNALDALTLTGSSAAADAGKVDRHPERRFKAAYMAFEARRLVELEVENPGLRRNQRVDVIRREFAKHPDNPFNQAAGRFDSTGAELKEIADRERARMEGMLGGT